MYSYWIKFTNTPSMTQKERAFLDATSRKSCTYLAAGLVVPACTKIAIQVSLCPSTILSVEGAEAWQFSSGWYELRTDLFNRRGGMLAWASRQRLGLFFRFGGGLREAMFPTYPAFGPNFGARCPHTGPSCAC